MIKMELIEVCFILFFIIFFVYLTCIFLLMFYALH